MTQISGVRGNESVPMNNAVATSVKESPASSIASDALGQMFDKNAVASVVAKSLVNFLFSPEGTPEVLNSLLGMLNGLKAAGAKLGSGDAATPKDDTSKSDLLLQIARTPFATQAKEAEAFNSVDQALSGLKTVSPELKQAIGNAVESLKKGEINLGEFNTIVKSAVAGAKAEPAADPIAKGLGDLLANPTAANLAKANAILGIFVPGFTAANGAGNGNSASTSNNPGNGSTITIGSTPNTGAAGGSSGVNNAAPTLESKYPVGVSRVAASDGNTYMVISGALANNQYARTAAYTAVSVGGAKDKGYTGSGDLIVNFGKSANEDGINRLVNSLRQSAFYLSSDSKQAVAQMVSANQTLPTSASVAEQILQESQRGTA